MKKIFTVMAISIVSVFATANKSAETAHNNMVYYLEGSNEYHTTALGAHLHSGEGRVMKQRESGCKSASMHKCLLCKGAELVRNIK